MIDKIKARDSAYKFHQDVCLIPYKNISSEFWSKSQNVSEKRNVEFVDDFQNGPCWAIQSNIFDCFINTKSGRVVSYRNNIYGSSPFNAANKNRPDVIASKTMFFSWAEKYKPFLLLPNDAFVSNFGLQTKTRLKNGEIVRKYSFAEWTIKTPNNIPYYNYTLSSGKRAFDEIPKAFLSLEIKTGALLGMGSNWDHRFAPPIDRIGQQKAVQIARKINLEFVRSAKDNFGARAFLCYKAPSPWTIRNGAIVDQGRLTYPIVVRCVWCVRFSNNNFASYNEICLDAATGGIVDAMMRFQ